MKLPPTITSRTNARVKALRAAFSGKASKPGELVGIEGIRMVMEAMHSKLRMDTIYLREDAEPMLRLLPPEVLAAAPVLLLQDDIFDSVMDTQNAQPLAATVEIPAPAEVDFRHTDGVVLVLDGIQDPGNLGTLIRSAEAFAAQKIFITPGTVNPWNPKVLRASAGSGFRAPLVKAALPEIQHIATERGIRLVAAVAQEANVMIAPLVNLRPPCALMIGNEGNGLSAQALAIADEKVFIPCLTESLNAGVAGSVLLYEALRQRIEHAAARVEAAMPQRVM